MCDRNGEWEREPKANRVNSIRVGKNWTIQIAFLFSHIAAATTATAVFVVVVVATAILVRTYVYIGSCIVNARTQNRMRRGQWMCIARRPNEYCVHLVLRIYAVNRAFISF